MENSYVKNCLFEVNDATADGGGQNYTSHSAGHEGGGLFKPFFENIALPYCTALSAVTLARNYAGARVVGGAMYH